ncbi:molybdenum cofactor guanylyltransferase [Paenibacillus sp. GCM10023250]|uniref:molybdenum cofactor guanylyltransferase n=1 Tax=Paenibacillus sp. GCM10023250 TaxID=3252648 RepID=UPI00360F6540
MRVEEVTGIILAGGRSSRMGRNKALLPVGGKPLLRHIAEAMLAAGLKRIVVACGPAERADEYGPLLAGLPVEVGFAADRFPDGGPLAGLHAALDALPAPGYGFATACDMPAISAPLLARLLRAAEAAGPGRAEWAATVPAAGAVGGPAPASVGGPQLIRAAGQPFHALYHTSSAAELAARLARGDLRVMALAGALRTLELTPDADEEAAFANLNTPDAYERYVRAGE